MATLPNDPRQHDSPPASPPFTIRPAKPLQAARRPWRVALYVLLLVLVFLVVFRNTPHTIELAGWDDDLTTAKAAAQANNRPLLLFFHAKWCTACDIFKRDTLTEPLVAERLQKQFVPTSINMTAPDGPGARQAVRFDLDAIPTVIVIDPDGRILGRVTGSLPADRFGTWLDNCLARRADQSPGGTTDERSNN